MRAAEYPRLVFIGHGGFWRTVRDMAFFASFHMPASEFVLVDGKTYKPRNRNHECFDGLGNKARVQTGWLTREFPGLRCHAVCAFIGSARADGVEPVDDVIRSGDVVFLQVDNHRSKLLVDRHASTLDDITIISGGVVGNDGADRRGPDVPDDQLRVQVYVRRGGVDVTPPFASYCQDIADPPDELPKPPCPGLYPETEVGGRDLPHPFVLLAGSTFMVNAFYQVWCLDAGLLTRVIYDTWHDIRQGKTRVETVTVREATVALA